MARLKGSKHLMLLVVSAFLVFSAGQAQADSLFSGGYAVGNFTTTLVNSDGGVNTSQAPASVTLTGGNNGTEFFGETLFSLIAPTTTPLSFDWTYTTFDCCGSSFDPAGYEINGTKFQLSPPTSVPFFSGSGQTTANVVAGESFGFYVDTVDNFEGPATLTVGPVAAPELSSLLLVGAGLLGLGTLLLRKRMPEQIRS